MDDGGNRQAEGAEAATPLYFGNYEVLKSIGKGKFAIVYRAKKIGDEEAVALKRIAVDMMNEKAREKCLKEVRLLQSLDHPNIIHYMDSFITENDLVIVYEWAAAGDLKRQLRKAQERGSGFEERVIWKYFSQICNAMKHMHDKRIMHRDLKPANIFLTLDGTIKVGDLGLSRELSEHTIQAHSKVGTPLYMSPEVLKGEGYDFKSDIWSLGCLLYELAMLKSPFKSEGLNLYSLFQKISNGDYQPLPEQYSERLRTLTYSMISTMPEDRPEIAHVCAVAQEMRTLTAERDKSARSKKGSAAVGSGGSSGTGNAAQTGGGREEGGQNRAASRPNSGMLSRPQTEGGGGKEAEDPAQGNQFTTGPPKLVREGSFQIERVNSEWDGADDGADKTGRARSKSPAQPRSRGDSGRRNAGGRDSSGNPRDATWEEGEDDATVGLGQAPFHRDDYQELQGAGGGLGGVAVLGSDASPGRNKQRSSKRDDKAQDRPDERGKQRTGDSDTAGPPRQPPYVDRRDGAGAKIQAAEMAQTKRNYTAQPAVPPSSSAVSNAYRRAKDPTQQTTTGAAADRNSSREGRRQQARPQAGGEDEGAINKNGLQERTVRGEGDSREPVRVGGRTLEEHLEGSSVAFAVMEAAYDKLVALGCPLDDPAVEAEYRSGAAQGRGRLLPFHFACDLQIFPQVAGHGAGHPFMQFNRFAHVACWLCGKIGGPAASAVANIDLAQDTPVMTAKQLLRAAQVCALLLQPACMPVLMMLHRRCDTGGDRGAHETSPRTGGCIGYQSDHRLRLERVQPAAVPGGHCSAGDRVRPRGAALHQQRPGRRRG
jgi:serine/threonine protein kinase